jgi:hypothetical protein
MAYCFLGLGCFAVAVAVGQGGLFLANQHGAMLEWVGRKQKTILAILFLRWLFVAQFVFFFVFYPDFYILVLVKIRTFPTIFF